MKLAIYIIFYGGLFYGFWLVYALIQYKYGKKIKEYRQRQRNIRECEKILLEARLQTLEKIKKRNEVVEVEVEEVSPNSMQWDVFNTKRLSETIVSTELIIIEND